MTQGIYTVTANVPLTADVMEMTLAGDTSAITRPGQFINIKLDGFFLRRPISVCRVETGELTIVYKVVGHGTEAMRAMVPGAALDVLVGLGNGFDTGKSGDRPLLIGGGVGVPPMYQLCRELAGQGKSPTAILGFNKKSEVFYEDAFRDLEATVFVTTADGSYGIRGFVTDAMPDAWAYTYVYACGPEPMLRAVDAAAQTGGQLSFEERMGCGFGACMGCSCETKYGSKRICRDGPVLEREEIIW